MERRLRILILTHHYPPEVGAPQTRLSGTAAFLAERGHDVRVLTAMPSYPTGVIAPAYRGRFVVRERIGGIPVVRTPTFARPGGSIRLRISETYTDPKSYRQEGEELVFDRSFGRPRNAVVLPVGWYLTSSSIPALVSETSEGRIRLDFVNPRPDEIAVLIKARRRP